jgi:uncharacterized protein YjdB
MNRRNRMKQFAAVSASVVLWAGACDSNPTAPPRIAMVAVSPARDTITAGASVQLTATTKDAGGNAIAGLAVTWSSDNPAAATVSDAGLVQGVASGIAQISATAQEKSGSAAITVRVPVASVFVSPAIDTILPGTTVKLSVTPRDSAGHPLGDRAVGWQSSNPAVATVTDLGVVTGVTEGQVAVSAVVEGTQGTAAITVHIPATSVSVTPALDTLFTAATVQLVATIRDSAGDSLPDRVIAWITSDSSVATVSPAGLARAVAPGTATITATVEGKSGKARIVVRVLNVTGVTGEWAFTALFGSLSCDEYGVCHVDDYSEMGSVVFTQNGTSLIGTAGWVNDVIDGAPTYASVDAGSVSGSTVQFTLGACQFRGSITGGSLSGTHTCADYDADWSAVRAGPVVSFGLRLGRPAIVVGERTWVRGEPLDAAGHQLFAHRPTFSSSNPSVATAGDSGFVKGVGSGTATITATDAGFTAATQVTVRSIRLTSVAATSRHACALTNDGAAWCWGWNDGGQLGNGREGEGSLAPVPVAGGLTFTTLSVNADNTCGLAPEGAAYCWGRWPYGLLLWTPVAVSGGLRFAAVTTGAGYACGLTASGSAYCWGVNYSGQLGNGTTADSPTPVAVSGGLTFAAVSAGGSHTCGVTTGAAAYCWGSNGWGELGDGSTKNSPTPVPVGGSLSFASVSAGGGWTCGLGASGTAYCWGSNQHGELGDGSTTYNRSTPGAVVGGLSFASISTGGGYMPSPTCAITASGAAYCWGSGTLGDGSSNGSSTPVAVAGGLAFASVSAGAPTCGHATDGRVYCWGSYTGDGTATVRLVPVRVLGQP